VFVAEAVLAGGGAVALTVLSIEECAARQYIDEASLDRPNQVSGTEQEPCGASWLQKDVVPELHTHPIHTASH